MNTMQTIQGNSSFYTAPITGASGVVNYYLDTYLDLRNLSWNHLRYEKEQISQLIKPENDHESAETVNRTTAKWAHDTVLPALYDAVSTLTYRWVSPHITASEAGDIVLEWWNQTRKITLYISDTEIEYIRTWGADIESQMESNLLEDSKDFRSAWVWLYS